MWLLRILASGHKLLGFRVPSLDLPLKINGSHSEQSGFRHTSLGHSLK